MGVAGFVAVPRSVARHVPDAPPIRLCRHFNALRSSARRHATPAACFLPATLHLTAPASARSYTCFRLLRMTRVAARRAKSMIWAIRPRREESVVDVSHRNWISGSVCVLFLAACSEPPSPSAPPSTASANTPPPAVAPAVPPVPSGPGPVTPPTVDAGARAVDSPATRPMDSLSKEKEVNSMPLAGQGNNHSSPSLEKPPGK